MTAIATTEEQELANRIDATIGRNRHKADRGAAEVLKEIRRTHALVLREDVEAAYAHIVDQLSMVDADTVLGDRLEAALGFARLPSIHSVVLRDCTCGDAEECNCPVTT